MVRKSQACQKIGGSTNSAFLALIPKEKGANTFSRFRPISLCNIGNKLITKVIANRMKTILPSITPENQGGFIQRRQIVDNFILVQEAIHSSLTRKEKGMVVKAPFIGWDTDFCWMSCTNLGLVPNSSAGSRHVSVNHGSPLWWIGGPLTFSKPLEGWGKTPLLFVLQASVLRFLLNKKQSDQEIMGLNIARGVKSINHALFADDSLLLGAASLPLAKRFKEVVDAYCEDSSSLNKGKCHIFCWNATIRTIQAISNCFGFAASSTWSSFKYLGLPVFQKRALSRDWLPLLEKFKSKIRSWGFNWLNLASKTVLIKAVLNSLPIYQAAVMWWLLSASRGKWKSI